MIIHTGLRTDIPAFYSKWFLNRLLAKEVLVRNPYNSSAVTSYDLNPDVVDLICFCTKNPSPLLGDDAVKILSRYKQFWFVTITPYGKAYEPNVPDKHEVIKSFRKLSKIVGPGNVSWRYDPVFIQGKYTVEQHKESFKKLCVELEGSTRECVFSFIDIYPKVQKNFPEAKAVPESIQFELAEFFAKTAAAYGIKAKACCENLALAATGVDVSGCMTSEVYERAAGVKLDFPTDRRARKECNCLLGFDIGAYNTCAHFCRYCYANYSREKVMENMKRHDPDSPFLIGGHESGDVIHKAVQHSWKETQQTLDL